MTELREIASGLQFPEGPIAMSDGSVVLVEMDRGTLSRVAPDGSVSVVADCGGGPNGAAIGPDGLVYLCNNGGLFEVNHVEGVGNVPSRRADHESGSIQRVDLSTGAVETIYTECDGRPLSGPNDLVFDTHGGFWFTDHGVMESDDRPGVLYAPADGGPIRAVAHHTDETNGIGLSPDGTKLYVAETMVGRLWEWDITDPGEVALDPGSPAAHGGRLLHKAPDGQLFDSLAVDGEGWVCVGTLVNGGVTCVSPDGSQVEHVPVPDVLVTNICFGGDDLLTAYVTASAGGTLQAMPWPRPGLRLAF